MAYKLIYTKSAFRDIQKLDTIVKRRIGKKLKTYAATPFRFAKKLSHQSIGSYRFRIGDHRVVFDIAGDTIVILQVRHRREIYKK